MKQSEHPLRIVRLLDPYMCLQCRFAVTAVVEMEDSGTRRMMHCRRLDCDNWETEATPQRPVSISIASSD